MSSVQRGNPQGLPQWVVLFHLMSKERGRGMRMMGHILLGIAIGTLAMAVYLEPFMGELNYYKRYHDDFTFMLSEIRKEGHAWCIPLEHIKELK